MSALMTGARVYAIETIPYHGTQVIHKGGKGTIVGLLDSVPYVRWDWTGETYPADVRQIRRIG